MRCMPNVIHIVFETGHQRILNDIIHLLNASLGIVESQELTLIASKIFSQ